MKFFLVFAATVSSAANAFVAPSICQRTTTQSILAAAAANDSTLDRSDFVKTLSIAGASAVATTFVPGVDTAQARGRATLEQSYERYAPRIRAGGEFYSTDLKKMVEQNDFAGIKNALAEVPKRVKSDLAKPDSGVAERARQAGQFSDARVLVAGDLFASSFSESSISPKTKKMQAAIAKVRAVVEEMQSTAKQALGEESSGGLFGFGGGKKPSQAELAKKMRQLYVEGGNAWNEFIYAANDNLALQFDKFPYAK